MADDDDDVRGEPRPGDLLGPQGPRRSNFTPAPLDSESLEAANSVFGDDAIAAALAAELARVSSGPIPIQYPSAATQSATSTPSVPTPSVPTASVPNPHTEQAQFAPEPVSAPAAPEAVQSEPAPSEPVGWAPAEADLPTSDGPTSGFAPTEEAVAEPAPAEPAAAEPAPTEAPSWSTEPPRWSPEAAQQTTLVPAQPPATDEAPPIASEEQAPGADDQAPVTDEQAPVADAQAPSTSSAPVGPPDWASSLFGQPTPTVRDESEQPQVQDPFAPSSPSFAPSTGAFPPPSALDGSAGAPPSNSDPDALRELYRGAPAPTVPPADAPPPPGYEASFIVPSTPSPGSAPEGSAPPAQGDEGSRRRALDDEDAAREASAQPIAAEPITAEPIASEAVPAEPPADIAALQAELHLDEQDAREFASWQSSMTAIGTPEALAEVARARTELAGSSLPAANEPSTGVPAPEVAAEPAPPAEEPVAYLPPPAEDAVPVAPPTIDDMPVFLAPPAPEPVGQAEEAEDQGDYLPPQFEAPGMFIASPTVDEGQPAQAVDSSEVAAAPPVDEPAAFLPPPFEEPVDESPAPPAEEPYVFAPPPPAEESVSFLPPPAEEPASFLPPPAEEPVSFLPPPSDEPTPYFAEPPAEQSPSFAPAPEPSSFAPAAFTPAPLADEPAAYLPPPVDEPVAFAPAPAPNEPEPVLAPPTFEPAAVTPPPPTEEPAAFLAAPPPAGPGLDPAEPAGEPFATLPPPSAEPQVSPFEDPYGTTFPPVPQAPTSWDAPPPTAAQVADDADPFNAFAVMAEERQAAEAAPPPPGQSPFPGFAPPTEQNAFDTFDAPADPRDLQFEPAPIPPAPATESIAPVPDSPLFIEPPALVEPAAPVDGVAELYRAAGEVPPPVAIPGPPQTSATDDPAPVPPDATPQGTPGVPFGFEDILSGSATSAPAAPPVAWAAPGAPVEPAPVEPPAPTGEPSAALEPPAPADEPEPGGRRPFGAGVERDDAVDPSDSIFGSAPGLVTVNTAGVAVIPDRVTLDSQPVRLVKTGAIPLVAPAVALVAPRVVPPEPVGLEPTPEAQRVGRSARLFWLWFAANSSIAAIVFGAIIFALGVSLRQAIVATLAGVALSFIPLGLGTLAGKRSGQPTMVVSRATFGTIGNILPALLALFSRLLWAAALLWILGKGTAEILIGAQLNGGFTADELTLVTMALGFIVAVVIAYFGYGLIAKVQLVISILSGVAILGFIALTLKYVNFSTALTTGDGPWILVVTGAVLVFSFVGLAWANSSADVARYQRPGSSGAASMLWATFGAGLPSFVLVAYGALLAASNHTLAANIAKDPLDSLGRLLPVWYPAPLLAATVLSLLSGVVLSMYSGGFALQAAGLRLRRPLSTLLVGVLVIIIAVSLDFSVPDVTVLLRDVATTIAVPIAAWVGIFAVETMIRRRPLDSSSLLARGGIYPDVRWFNFIALILVSVVGFGFLSATIPALSWEGYVFTALGVPLDSQLAQSDLGVFVALLLGMLVALATGFTAVRKQEGAQPLAE